MLSIVTQIASALPPEQLALCQDKLESVARELDVWRLTMAEAAGEIRLALARGG